MAVDRVLFPRAGRGVPLAVLRRLRVRGGWPRSSPRPCGAPAPGIQLNALQALCRQVFTFRIVITAVSTPFALSGASLPVWLVGGAICLTVLVSYAVLRDWDRFGPLLLRHPALLAADAACLAPMLVTATSNSPVGYITVSTSLLAGLLYGWRRAGLFTGLQMALLCVAYHAWGQDLSLAASTLLLAGFCVVAGVVGVTLRNLMFRFGSATHALSEARSRLAVTDAVEAERTRLAREMHDSVAKTLHGLALAAEGLARSADRTDPGTLGRQAAVVASAARRAASESRDILSGLRGETWRHTDGTDLADELRRRVKDFEGRTGIRADFEAAGPEAVLPAPVVRQALTIAEEALENAHRHGDPTHVQVTAARVGRTYRLTVYDDGRGLPPSLTLSALRERGHFGLLGMVERAAEIGARLRVGRGTAAHGTEVRLELPLHVPVPPPPPPTTGGPQWRSQHSSTANWPAGSPRTTATVTASSTVRTSRRPSHAWATRSGTDRTPRSWSGYGT
ncbi:sensor histidine kinase [Streptomyces sp. NPDC048172]|uniref:sensor histidine kinase n=1 Tax=Streptomyces sp. NPDC048172 TaxID=3365505 RepID=UPI003710394D